MTSLLVAGLHPLVGVLGAVDEGGGWLYDLLTKFGVQHSTARTVVDLIVRPVSIVLVILVAMVAARLGSKAIRRFLERIAATAAARSSANRSGARVATMGGVIANVWRFFVFVVAVAIILGQLGIDLAPLLASATIIGATLGFGAQLIVRDYISGFLLAVEDQYSVGETVTVDLVTGVVEDVTMRVTRLRGVDGTVYFVPNGDIRLLGNTSRGWARAVVDLVLPGTSGDDVEGVRHLLETSSHEVTQRPEFIEHSTEGPTVVTLINSDAATFTLRITVHTIHSQRDPLTRALREAAIVALVRADKWPGEPTPPVTLPAAT
jgi:moderate conductance mechanosensitive channel